MQYKKQFQEILLALLFFFIALNSSFASTAIKAGCTLSNFYGENTIWKTGVSFGIEKELIRYKIVALSSELGISVKSSDILELPIYDYTRKSVISYDVKATVGYLEVPFYIKIDIPGDILKKIQIIAGYSYSMPLFDNSTMNDKGVLFSYDPYKDQDKQFPINPERYGLNTESGFGLQNMNSGFMFGAVYKLTKLGLEIRYRRDKSNIGPLIFISEIDKKFQTVQFLISYTF